jgi:ABC-type antimicrobial peptide transport system permease subunit
MGVRIAIGASRRDVLALIVGRAMRLTAIGLGVGVLLAAGAGQLLRSQIFGVSPLDPLTFVVVIVLLTAVAFLAAWLPARRAARVDPIVALQAE